MSSHTSIKLANPDKILNDYLLHSFESTKNTVEPPPAPTFPPRSIEPAERITDHRGELNEMVKAASDLLGYLEKAIAADEVDIVGTDIGAAGVRDRLERLAAAVKAAERDE